MAPLAVKTALVPSCSSLASASRDLCRPSLSQRPQFLAFSDSPFRIGSSVTLVTVSALAEEKQKVKTQKRLPPSARDATRHSTSGVSESGEEAKDVYNNPVQDAVKAAVKAAESASIETVGTAAMYTGVAAVGTLLANSVLGSLDALPLLPSAMQAVGVAYVGMVGSRILAGGQTRSLEPTSPMRAVMEIVEGPSAESSAKFRALDSKSQEELQELVDQRDAAVKQAMEFRAAGTEMGRVMAEKEALEAVALQLAQERDTAMGEVSALKAAVTGMTDRMKAIEMMLAEEVRRLQEQNVALETVALALASERDQAIHHAGDMKSLLDSRSAEKKALEVLAAELIQERDTALAEVKELKKVVATLSEVAGSTSGLTSQQESFIKSRARAVRAQFVDITKPYAEQKEEVNKLVSHLVDEYGAPNEWTGDYIRQFLNSSSIGHKQTSPKNPETSKKSAASFHF